MHITIFSSKGGAKVWQNFLSDPSLFSPLRLSLAATARTLRQRSLKLASKLEGLRGMNLGDFGGFVPRRLLQKEGQSFRILLPKEASWVEWFFSYLFFAP